MEVLETDFVIVDGVVVPESAMRREGWERGGGVGGGSTAGLMGLGALLGTSGSGGSAVEAALELDVAESPDGASGGGGIGSYSICTAVCSPSRLSYRFSAALSLSSDCCR
jgi:hypothetical protein